MSTIQLTPGAVPLAAWRDVYRGTPVDPRSGLPRRDRSPRPARSRPSSPEASRSMASTPASASSPACASRPPTSRSCSATSCCRTPRASARRCRCAIARLMMALKLASLAQGASGVRRETVRLLEALLDKGLTPVVPCPGLGRRLGRSGAARPHVGDDDRRRRRSSSTARWFRPNGRWPRSGLSPLVLGAKEGLALLNGTQFSTAYALAGLFETEMLFGSALVTGALATDAARGSDAPFDPRIHALRRHAGQIDAAHALRRLMEGSAIRVSHLVGDERVQDPVLPALPAAGHGRRARHLAPRGDDAGDRGQRRHRQSADLRRYRRGPVGRQLPRRAGRLRRRHPGPGALRDRLAGRTAHRHAGRSGAVGPAGVPDAASPGSIPDS